MKNEYVRGGPNPHSGGYGYGGDGYGYGGGYGYGYGGGDSGNGGPQRSLKDYLLMLRERIWYIIVAFFIIFSGSALYTFNKTKVYTAAATVQLLRDDVSALGESFQMEQNQIRSAEDLNTQINILQSGAIIKAVEQRLQDEMLQRFMAPYKNALSLQGPLTAAGILGSNRKIIPQRMSMMVNVAYSHPDPIVAAKVANLIAKEFIDYNLKLNIDASMKAVEDLRIRADQQKERVENLEYELADYREEKSAVSLDNKENIAREQLARLNTIKSDNENVFDNFETRWRLIENYKHEGKDLWELPFITDQPRVSNLLSRISETRINISSLSKRYREKHPAMIQQIQTLQEAEQELKLAVKNAVDKIESGYEEAKKNFEMSSRRLAEKEKELIDLSKTRVEFNSLMRELEVQQSFFQALNTRMTTEKAQVNLKNPNARIVDEALPPPDDRPSSPNVVMNLAAGFFGGLAIGFGLAFAIAFLDDRIKSAFDIEGTIGLPLIGVVPRIKRLDTTTKAQAVALNSDRHVTENFRTIHSALKLNEESKNAKVIMTTSTVPGEGKSFISSNMALTFANHGEKTLLLDGDLRLPNVARSLNLENGRGLLVYIERGTPIDEVLLREVYPNLDVLPSGGKSKNPTQLLNSAQFESLMAELRDRYDRIVIDTPPLAAVSDSLNLLPLVDGVVYVIRFNTVKRKTAVVNVRRLWESNTPVFGAILNNINASLSSYYYSDKSYQDYYIHEEKKMEQEQIEEEQAAELQTRA